MSVTKYKCIKCGTAQSGGSHPLIGRCPKGEGHEWVMEDGVQKHYRCIKCGSGQFTHSHPLIGVCCKGGGHEWRA